MCPCFLLIFLNVCQSKHYMILSSLLKLCKSLFIVMISQDDLPNRWNIFWAWELCEWWNDLTKRNHWRGVSPAEMCLDVTIKSKYWHEMSLLNVEKLLIYREQAWQRAFIGLWTVHINLQTQFVSVGVVVKKKKKKIEFTGSWTETPLTHCRL